jgi:hypothetical protein
MAILKMRTQDVVLILLAVVVLFLLLQKVVSSFTSNDVQTFQSNFMYADVNRSIKSTVDFYLATLNGQPMMPMVNKILADATANKNLPPVQPLVPYTSESQLSTMFGDASKNGESGLTFTDRYLLRYLTVLFIMFLNAAQDRIGQVTWDTQGKPNFADEVLPKNQSIQDSMKFIFQMIQSSTDGQTTEDMVKKLNTILPPNLTPYANLNDYNERQSKTPPDPSIVFTTKYIFVGPAYLTWVAENYYKLDPAFKCFNVPSKDATNSQMSVPTPAPAQAIVPTPAP